MKWMTLAFLVLTLGCGAQSDGAENNGANNANNGANNANNGANNNGASNNGTSNNGAANNGAAEIPGSAAVVAAVFGTGGGLFVDVAGGLQTDGEALQTESNAGNETDQGARDAFENGVAGNSIVVDGSCVAFEWARLTVTVTFSDCVTEQTGATLDGSLTATVSFRPVTFSVSAMNLSVDGNTFDGNATFAYGDGPSLTAAFDYSNAEGTSSISLSDASISVSSGTATVGASGTVLSGMTSATFTATSVTWDQGSCLPDGGTLAYTDQDGKEVTLGFLETTPATGEVDVTVAPFPTVTTELLAPCS